MKVWDRSGDPRRGLGQVKQIGGSPWRSGTVQGTLREVQDGSADPPWVQDGSGDPRLRSGMGRWTHGEVGDW